ncbi:hypothetical protein ACI77I_12425 [Pseudomonas sp. D47]|uniref:hypothetical protein n=1 Tax=Pseudomonas sp. D47 TaxID=3159447 RepID=UPI00387B7EC5
MDTHNPGSLSLLLISCALSASVSFPVLAAGDGVIVTSRDVQGHMYGRPSFGPDPYPSTANANPSREIISATGELSDLDIGGISSGSSIARSIQASGNLSGLSATQNSMSTLGNSATAGHGAGSGMGGQISDSIQRGMAPLNNIGSMMGGK